jgi:hypothetical protein
LAVHIWALGLYKLEAQDRLAIVSAYASGDLQTCVFVKKFIDDPFRKPQIESRIKLVKARYANLEALVKCD